MNVFPEISVKAARLLSGKCNKFRCLSVSGKQAILSVVVRVKIISHANNVEIALALMIESNFYNKNVKNYEKLFFLRLYD